MAFAKSNDTASYKPHVPIATIKQEYPQAKIMVAIGGWGDTSGFSAAAKSDAGITKFASDIKTMLDANGLDGVDIDWEYPGGNGADYKDTPNSEKTNEIAAFPKMLTAIRTAIGKDKVLSIAVPGKTGDMLAFTAETGKTIWPAVDFVNVMSYDLMNRRDKVTAHHSSVKDCTASIKDYTSIGCPAEKLNLGFAYYAKYFTTAGDCGSKPLGCPIVDAEKADGSDALTSGAFTFEKANMASPNNATMAISSDGTCGPDKGKCPSGCCSQYGNCGTTAEHCNNACQFAFGTGCQGPDIAASWQKALVDGTCDQEAGGQYYFDAQNKLFWTWDTPDLIDRKYTEIVKAMGVGGVMAWSLGEDSYDWSHVKKLGQLAGSGGGGYGGGGSGLNTTTPTMPTPSPETPEEPIPSEKPTTTVNKGISGPSGTGYPAIPSPTDAVPAMPKASDTVPSDTVPKPSDTVPSGVTPPVPGSTGTGSPAAPKDDGYEWEETCTRRRVKKRSTAAKHVHAKRGHVGNAFLA
jgi:chitinase